MNPYGGETNQGSPTVDPVNHLERVTRAQLSKQTPGRAQWTFFIGDMELGVWRIQTEELIILGLMLIYRGNETIINRNLRDIANQAKSKESLKKERVSFHIFSPLSSPSPLPPMSPTPTSLYLYFITIPRFLFSSSALALK